MIPALVLMLTVSAALTLAVQPQTRWNRSPSRPWPTWASIRTGCWPRPQATSARAGETVTPLQHLWALSVAAQVLLAAYCCWPG